MFEDPLKFKETEDKLSELQDLVNDKIKRIDNWAEDFSKICHNNWDFPKKLFKELNSLEEYNMLQNKLDDIINNESELLKSTSTDEISESSEFNFNVDDISDYIKSVDCNNIKSGDEQNKFQKIVHNFSNTTKLVCISGAIVSIVGFLIYKSIK